MARPIRSSGLETPTARARLAVRKKPYTVQLAPGIHLAYRRNKGAGVWSVKTPLWLKKFALADDRESANGDTVLSYFDAQERGRKLARAGEGHDPEQPTTVAMALDAYEGDLKVRSGATYNASSVRNHCSPTLLSKPVALVAEKELRNWRNGLVTNDGLKPSSANRIAKSFKAALNLAAKGDKRIRNSSAWKHGLSPLPGGNHPPRDNFNLPAATIHTIVRECYVDDAEFGALIDVLANTGSRESQVLRLWPNDLLDANSNAPRLMMPCSRKGRDRQVECRPLPITPALAKMLQKRAEKRGPRPLFDRIWNMAARFREVLKRLDLDLTLTPYVMRHASIIRMLIAHVPVRFVAYHHDTSVVEIERTYARYIGNASDDLSRKGLLADAAEPVRDNVIKLPVGA
jgi:integrase